MDVREVRPARGFDRSDVTAVVSDRRSRGVFGDSTHAGVEFVEAYLRTRFPDARVELLDLGLPSETVSGLSEEGHAGGAFPRPDLHERLGRVLEKAKPDFVVACYGMNDGIYLPFDAGRFQKFQDGIQRLRERCAAAGAKVLHVTPQTFDQVKGGHPGYSSTLDRYSDWLLSQRAEGWATPAGRCTLPSAAATIAVRSPAMACRTRGHWLIARETSAIGVPNGIVSPTILMRW